jgi:phosphonoacetaldehyde hydrolase
MRHIYRGPLKAVIFDWAGTTVDFGCFAPVVVLQEVFAAAGVAITDQEARKDMGLPKKDHIRTILQQDRVGMAWASQHGRQPAEADVDSLYQQFIPLQSDRLPEHSNVIAGVAALIGRLRARGLKIGSSTGYTRAMLDQVMETAAVQGYRPDTSVTPEEAGGGRPHPWMSYVNMQRLGVYPPEACVKIGDTESDMQEGVNAGMWTVGITDSGNEIGLSQPDLESLSESERQRLRAAAADRLNRAGADFVIHSLDQLEAVLDQIDLTFQG